MLYLDCEEYCNEHNMTLEQLYKAGTDVGVMWQDDVLLTVPYAIRLNLDIAKSKSN